MGGRRGEEENRIEEVYVCVCGGGWLLMNVAIIKHSITYTVVQPTYLLVLMKIYVVKPACACVPHFQE